MRKVFKKGVFIKILEGKRNHRDVETPRGKLRGKAVTSPGLPEQDKGVVTENQTELETRAN